MAATLQNYNTPTLPQLDGGDQVFWRNELQKISKSVNLLVKGQQGTASFTVNVKNFGAKGDGVTDDTKAIQAAINAVAAFGGGTVLFPPGIYLITSTLVIGNGSSAAWSTVHGVILQGASPPPGAFTLAGGAASTILLWGGAASGNPAMVKYQGPLAGWGISNLELNANNVATVWGLQLISASYGYCQDMLITGVQTGIHTSTVPQGALGGNPNTMHNRYTDVSITLHDQTGGSTAVFLTNDSNSTVTTNTCYELFYNITIGADGHANALIGVDQQVCDSCIFIDLHVAFGPTVAGGTAALFFDYSVNANFPSSNKFFGVDPNGATASFGTTGTATVGDNVIEGLIRTNGAVPAIVSGVSFIPAGWFTYTPTPVWGGGQTSTFTINAARYSKEGTTVSWQLDVTISAAGTVTNQFTFTLPTTPGSGGGGAGRECVNSFIGVVEQHFGANATAAVSKTTAANFANNDRIIISGVYESQ